MNWTILKKARIFLAFPTLIFLIVVGFSLFNFNGSSIGIYNKVLLGDNYVDNNIILGQPRSIRSDEWLVETPLAASQYFVNFKQENKLIGLGEKTSVFPEPPTNHWTTVYKPQNWAFFFLPFENAFAFKWWVRGFLLIFGAYLFLYKLTKGNLFLSIGGSISIFFTPFIQWWYSTTAVEGFAYLFFGLFTFINIFEFKKLTDLLFYSLLMVYFATSFVLLMYPPFLVPLTLLGITFCVGYILNNIKYLRKVRLKFYFFSLAIITILFGISTITFYLDFRDVIEIIRNTSYPGNREIFGGGFSWLKLFTGFFNLILQKTRPIPPVFGNESETSNTFIIFPFVLPITLFFSLKNLFLKKQVDAVSLALTIYILLLSIWMFVGLPNLLTKGLLLTLSSSERALSGIIAANFLLIFYYISRAEIAKNLNYKISTLLLSLAAGLNIIFLGYYIRYYYPTFGLNQPIILLGAFSSFFLVYFVLMQRKILFILVLVVFSVISSIKVNPIYKGLQPILYSKVSNEFNKFDMSNNSRWVVYDDLILANLLVANGHNSLNSTHIYPQKNIWSRFDPESQNYKTWNRYAHVVFSTPTSKKRIEFSLNQADYFTVKVDPCDKLFNEFEVNYFVFHYENSFSCLKEIKKITYTVQPIYIYQRISQK